MVVSFHDMEVTLFIEILWVIDIIHQLLIFDELQELEMEVKILCSLDYMMLQTGFLFMPFVLLKLHLWLNKLTELPIPDIILIGMDLLSFALIDQKWVGGDK